MLSEQPTTQAEPSSAAAIVLVCANEQERAALATPLGRRYGAEYDVLAVGSVDAGLDRLRRLREAGRDVALVLADHHLPDGSGVAFLTEARSAHPAARRALLVDQGDAWSGGPDDVCRAVAAGAIDTFVPKPVVTPDEAFHLAITELLDAWARAQRPRFPLIQIVGDRWSLGTHHFCDHLARLAVPFALHAPDSPEGRALLARAGTPCPLPVAVLRDGRVFVRPTAAAIVSALGLDPPGEHPTFDVAIVGGGPARLAAAVNAASEGLRVVVVEAVVAGGQAGTSALLRNYLGFPRGVSGADLAHRAYLQARHFGVQFLFARAATGLRTDGDTRVLALDDGTTVSARAVILAMGVSYRRLGIAGLDALLGRGVYYGAATTEASALAGEAVVVVGGANSAGQAALHLARFAARVTVVVRGPSLAASMSDYLVREIAARPNVAVRLDTEVVEARGDGRLRSLVMRDRTDGTTEEVQAAAIFALIGAAPRTGWLPATVARDAHGFILTGTASEPDGDAPFATSLTGVFAIGDVRAGSLKRVAAAVGEGSVVVSHIHDYLAACEAACLRDCRVGGGTCACGQDPADPAGSRVATGAGYPGRPA